MSMNNQKINFLKKSNFLMVIGYGKVDDNVVPDSLGFQVTVTVVEFDDICVRNKMDQHFNFFNLLQLN